MQTSRFGPLEERQGLALCLSGGGYRAALFHLGALRRLNELGALSQVDTVSAVSGGSILAAHLIENLRPWPSSPLDDWVARIETPFRALTWRNVRTPALARRLKPGNWLRSQAAVEGLADQYRRRLSALPLEALAEPSLPRFIISASDMQFGMGWVFDGGARRGRTEPRTGDGAAGYAPLPAWSLARAVAASSAAPPWFEPLRAGFGAQELTGGGYRSDDRDSLAAGISLTDGGVIDNMGLEAVWRDHQVVLVSNGGSPFRPARDRGLLWRFLRYTQVAGRQGERVRKRWLIRSFETEELDGAYWGIESSPERYDAECPGYSKDLAGEVISRIRTDLDRFSRTEAEVLIAHGYFLADAAIGRHVPKLADQGVEYSLPPPDRDSESAVRRDLWRSHKRTLLGRGWPR